MKVNLRLLIYLFYLLFFFSCRNIVEKEYYSTGELKSKTPYNQEHTKNGNVYTYYKNGQIKSKTPYLNGLIDGFEYNYKKDGIIESKTFWSKGVPQKEAYTYFDNGEIKTLTYLNYKGEPKFGILYDIEGNILEKRGNPMISINNQSYPCFVKGKEYYVEMTFALYPNTDSAIIKIGEINLENNKFKNTPIQQILNKDTHSIIYVLRPESKKSIFWKVEYTAKGDSPMYYYIESEFADCEENTLEE